MPAARTGSARPVPLSEDRLRAALCGPGRLWTRIQVLPRTGSTNEDALAQASLGQPEGLVIATEAQEKGRGRQGRSWQSLPGAALTFTVLLRPAEVPRAALGWVPLLAGVAVASALREIAGAGASPNASLKWPNDVLIGESKVAGILAEQAGDAIVVGIGVNVLGGAAELPVTTATSLELHGAGEVDRNDLLTAILGEFETWYRRWRVTGDADVSGLRQAYLRLSATVGGQVRAEMPGGRVIEGTAAGVDGSGRLVIRTARGSGEPVSAGDVWHLR